MVRNCLFVTAALFSSISWATPLGKSINDSTQAKVQVSASAQSTTLKVSAKTSSLGASYSIRESSTDARTMKEFVTAEGVVFAVSWEGLGRPDFSEIFGAYYDEYDRERRSQIMKGRNRNSMTVSSSGIVVTNSGHGSFMRGLAYVPSLLPPGVAAEDLK